MRIPAFIVALIVTLGSSQGATLEKLSLNDMIEKSTDIVRVRIVGRDSETRGPLIYTVSNVEVQERWKGAANSTMRVYIPGGLDAGYRQQISGAPSLREGAEYVLFLWTGRNGITHVIGLSQGVFTLMEGENGSVRVHRAASSEVMIDPSSGDRIQDQSLTIGLDELRDRVQSVLEAAAE